MKTETTRRALIAALIGALSLGTFVAAGAHANLAPAEADAPLFATKSTGIYTSSGEPLAPGAVIKEGEMTPEGCEQVDWAPGITGLVLLAQGGEKVTVSYKENPATCDKFIESIMVEIVTVAGGTRLVEPQGPCCDEGGDPCSYNSRWKEGITYGAQQDDSDYGHIHVNLKYEWHVDDCTSVYHMDDYAECHEHTSWGNHDRVSCGVSSHGDAWAHGHATWQWVNIDGWHTYKWHLTVEGFDGGSCNDYHHEMTGDVFPFAYAKDGGGDC